MKNETRIKNELTMMIMGEIKKDDYFIDEPVVTVGFSQSGTKGRPLVKVYNGRQLTIDSFSEDDVNGGFQAMDVMVNPAVFDLHGYDEGMNYCIKNAILKYKKMQK
tara:strand:- start:612 stop:929 length:318 start_codon:yes stop_codon:yes gene_type:complete